MASGCNSVDDETIMKVFASIDGLFWWVFFVPVSIAGRDPNRPGNSEREPGATSRDGLESNPYFDSGQERATYYATPVVGSQTRRIDDDQGWNQRMDRKLEGEYTPEGRGTGGYRSVGNHQTETEIEDRRIRESRLHSEPPRYPSNQARGGTSLDVKVIGGEGRGFMVPNPHIYNGNAAKDGTYYDAAQQYDHRTEINQDVNEPRGYMGRTLSDRSFADEPPRTYVREQTRGRNYPDQSRTYAGRPLIDSRNGQEEYVGRTTGERRPDHEESRFAGGTTSDSSSAEYQRGYVGGTARANISPNRPKTYVTDSSDEAQGYAGRGTGGRIYDDDDQRYDGVPVRDRNLNGEPNRENGRINEAWNLDPQRFDGGTAGSRTSADKLRRANDEDSSSPNWKTGEIARRNPNMRPWSHDRSNTYSRSTTTQPNTRLGRFKDFVQKWDTKIGRKFDRLDDKLTDYKDRAFDRLGDHIYNTKQYMKDRLDIKDDSSSTSGEYNKDGYRKGDLDPVNGGLAYV